VRSSIVSSLKTIKELDDLKLSNEIALRKKLEQGLDDDLSALAHIVQTRNEHKERSGCKPHHRNHLLRRADRAAVADVETAGLVDVGSLRSPRDRRAVMLLGGILARRKPPWPPNQKK